MTETQFPLNKREWVGIHSNIDTCGDWILCSFFAILQTGSACLQDAIPAQSSVLVRKWYLIWLISSPLPEWYDGFCCLSWRLAPLCDTMRDRKDIERLKYQIDEKNINHNIPDIVGNQKYKSSIPNTRYHRLSSHAKLKQKHKKTSTVKRKRARKANENAKERRERNKTPCPMP